MRENVSCIDIESLVVYISLHGMASCGYSLLVGGPCGTSSFSTPRMGNVLQSPSVAKMYTITSCIAKSSDDIAVDTESKLLLTRAGRWSPFRHYTSSKTNFSLDIFQNVIGIFISGIFETEESHLKITVCPRYRDLFGTRWRCPQVQGKILCPKGSIWIEKSAFSLCYERHEYACTSRLA